VRKCLVPQNRNVRSKDIVKRPGKNSENIPSKSRVRRGAARLSGQTLPLFRRALLNWYREHRRPLPWRQSRDPYRIWVAEIMLQQTRIAVVIPYYERFLERFPTIAELANSDEAEVLRLWSGLGYYQRARNLQQAARKIVKSHEGKFPLNAAAARTLPGIGAYTVAAILSIAADEPLAALDGNIARVLARLGAVGEPLREPQTWRKLQEEAQRLLAPRRPGDWNQAVMELGETICTPRGPRCDDCPVAPWCRARGQGIVEQFPAKRALRSGVRVTLAAAVLCDAQGRTLLLRAPGQHDAVLFSRLRQFPAIEVNNERYDNTRRNATTQLKRYLRSKLRLTQTSVKGQRPLSSLRHAVTFRDVELLPFVIRVARLPRCPGSETVLLSDVPHLPISSATRKIARAALEALGESRTTKPRNFTSLHSKLCGLSQQGTSAARSRPD
jgi:A/G-specific adenine glycosylase